MAMNRKQLELLFRINPNAQVVRSDNVLFVNSGAEKSMFNIRAESLDILVQGLNIPHMKRFSNT